VTRTELEDAIRDLVSTQLGVTTIWAHRTTSTGAAVPRPSSPYAMLNLVSDELEGLPDGRSDASYDSDEATYLESQTEDVYSRVSVRAYGSGAWDRLQNLRQYLQSAAARETADGLGIGISGLSGVTDLTSLDGAGWKGVCSMDLRPHRRDTWTRDEGYMEAADAGMTYEYPRDTTVATDTISADITP